MQSSSLQQFNKWHEAQLLSLDIVASGSDNVMGIILLTDVYFSTKLHLKEQSNGLICDICKRILGG